ncbi:hypothetical protein B0H13DRAFT_1922603 [Mycena leptocephala]|nr:hypothetical protein B0H13DRAFT_1922603 [Mycena leptocephala]
MAPSPPEHATSAVDQAYDAFDESSITLQEMVEKKLSAGSINRQTHTSLDRSMGIVPYTSSLVDPTRHASKERLYWLRDFCKEGIKAKTFSAPAHSMSQLYKMLETYEAHHGRGPGGVFHHFASARGRYYGPRGVARWFWRCSCRSPLFQEQHDREAGQGVQPSH